MSPSVVYMLDTNTVAYILNGRSSAARKKLAALDAETKITLSAITEAEIRYGMQRRPDGARWKLAVENFLAAVEILPWDSEAAHVYGKMRAVMTAQGKILSAMDLLIAAHAASVNAILVTSDKGFRQTKGFCECVNWATDIQDTGRR